MIVVVKYYSNYIVIVTINYYYFAFFSFDEKDNKGHIFLFLPIRLLLDSFQHYGFFFPPQKNVLIDKWRDGVLDPPLY